MQSMSRSWHSVELRDAGPPAVILLLRYRGSYCIFFRSKNFVYRSKNFVYRSNIFVYRSNIFVYRSKNYVYRSKNYVYRSKNFVYRSKNFVYRSKNFVHRSKNFVYRSINCQGGAVILLPRHRGMWYRFVKSLSMRCSSPRVLQVHAPKQTAC